MDHIDPQSQIRSLYSVYSDERFTNIFLIGSLVVGANPFNPPPVLRNAHVQTLPASTGPRKWLLKRQASRLIAEAEDVILQCSDGVRLHGMLLNTKTLDSPSDILTINGIPITKQISWSGIERKRLYQLLSSPLCSWVFGHIEVYNLPAVMAEHDKHIENAKYGGRNGEEINPGYRIGMVFEKRPLGL